MAKTVLSPNEFAIREGASFSPDLFKRPSLKINEDGTLSITFNYKLDDLSNLQTYIQNQSGIKFLNSGVFDKTAFNSFHQASNVSALSLSSNPFDQILLKSDTGDIELVTSAVKGREGDHIAFIVQ